MPTQSYGTPLSRRAMPNCGLARRHYSPPNTGTMTTTLPVSNASLVLRELEMLPLMSFVVYSSVHCIFVLRFQTSQQQMPKGLILSNPSRGAGCWTLSSRISAGNTLNFVLSFILIFLSRRSHNLSWLLSTLKLCKSESNDISVIRVSLWNRLRKVHNSIHRLFYLNLLLWLGTFHMVRLHFDWFCRGSFSVQIRHIIQQWPKRASPSSEYPTTALTKNIARWKARCSLRSVTSLSYFHVLITLPGCDITVPEEAYIHPCFGRLGLRFGQWQ